MLTPRFSIIIACYNEVNNIGKSIASVLNQTYPNKELLVIDGGSIDGTVDFIKANAQHISYWITEPDEGIYDAWNKAVNRATGDWIYFLGADDAFASSATLEEVAREIQKDVDVNVDIFCGAIQYGKYPGKICLPQSDKFPEIMFPHQGVFHSACLFANATPFSMSFKIRGDYHFLVKQWRERGLNIKAIDMTVAQCAADGISSAWNRRLEIVKETFLIYKEFDLRPYAPKRFWFYGKNSLKYALSRLRAFFVIKNIAAFLNFLSYRVKIRGDARVKIERGALLWNCKINARGRNVSARIGKHAMLRNVNIFICGDNATLEVGDHVRMTGGDLWLEDRDSQITIGDKTTIVSAHLAATEGKSIQIGADCMLASDIDIRTGDSHAIFDLRSQTRFNHAKDVVLGRHVWVGAHVCILKGSCICDGAVVGVGSIVTGEVSSNTIVGGNPAKTLRENIVWTRSRGEIHDE